MSNSLRILILTESPSDAELMERELHGSGTDFSSRRVETGDAFIKALDDFLPDLILSDLTLSSFDGLSALRIVRERAPFLPFIFVTDVAHEKAVVESMSQGVTNYVFRDRISRLSPAVTRAMEETRQRKGKTQAEKELKDLSSQLSAIIEHIPQGIFLLDDEGRLIHANSLGLEYLKKTEHAAIGEPLCHILGKPVQELLIVPPPFIWHEVEKEDNPKGIFAIAGRRIADAKVTVFVMRDVTEEKENLEKIHSQERLAAVGQMAAGIAHDFNNFLSTIIGYADFLLMTETMNEEMKTMIETIGQSGRSASTLIKQILDFSRKSETEMTLLDLKPFVKEFTKLIRELIPENIRISYTLGDGHYLVEGDPTKIKQLLVNLSINSRDAMPQGGVLNLSLTRNRIFDPPPVPKMPVGEEWITLSVADTGSGIPPDILSHIFEPFFTTKETGTGTGLGLSQVYGIVKQHNGFIDVQSEMGKGTIFTIYLPPAESEADLLSEENGSFMRGKGETILVVEDDHAMREFVISALSSLGYHVIAAHNGKEALKLFDDKKEEINLIITDVMLPEVGGIDMCLEIQRRKPQFPVIGMTGYDVEHFKGEVEKAGFRDILLKPFSAKKLSTVVAAALA
ncbi:MAG: response regulator [Thermodesulfovibrionales bacterium]|jgi:signal transduction histidine kinase/DNA-binding response OmpR family regulator